MKLGFISGTGKEGKALAIRFGMHGHSIFIGSRSTDKALVTENEIKLKLPKIDIKGSDYHNTVLAADIIFIALPYHVVITELSNLKDVLKNKIIIDTSVPMIYNKGKFNRDSTIKDSISSQLNDSLNSTRVISAFHTISHFDLNNINIELDHDVLYFANDSSAESIFLNLITTIKGLNPVKCGTLDLSFLVESQVPLLLNINKIYKKSTSIKIKGL
tara:strand:+ start:6782 stop:7429 length:648 start_codon:yes stop_codon:yes gene_type:complete